MSHTPTKKSVFDRIGGNSSPSGTTTVTATTKSTHGFCNAFIKTGSCPLGDACKYIHEQPNLEKPSGSKDEFRITKTITRVVDMSSSSMKSTVTVSNEQRPIVVSNSVPSSRTVIETVTAPADQSDRRMSSSDRKQSQHHSSSSKTKPSSTSNESSKKKSHSSSYDNRHSSSKKPRTIESDSSFSSPSDSEHGHSSQKHKKKSSHSTTSKHKKRSSISPKNHGDVEEETINDRSVRQTSTYGRSPKRTIVITKRKRDEPTKETSKESKSKAMPDIEIIGSKKVKAEKKPIETIHQQAENTKKSSEVKREKKSPSRSTSDQQRRHSSSTNTSTTSINERNIQIKTEDTKYPPSKTQNSSERYERSDHHASHSTPPIVQLSPTPPTVPTLEIPEKEPMESTIEPEKSTSLLPPSPICVILDDDSSPPPSGDKKDVVRQTSTIVAKKSEETEKPSSKTSKRPREAEKHPTKEKTSDDTDSKRKRLDDGSSKKVTSSSKSRNESRSTSTRSDVRHSVASSSRDESSSRKYKDKSDSKSNRTTELKDRTTTKSRSNTTRHDTTRSSSEKKRSSHRYGKERGLENVTDSEEHIDEPTLPKQTAIEAYMSMDWSSLSRDKRIPLNSQVTSRITRPDASHHVLSIADRLLTDEQKEKLHGVECQSLPLTSYMKQLQNQSRSSLIHSCQRRFGSCAKDMIEMRHKWFLRSIEPVQDYEFMSKEHYLAFQQAINSFLDKTPNDTSTAQIETTTADVLLS